MTDRRLLGTFCGKNRYVWDAGAIGRTRYVCLVDVGAGTVTRPVRADRWAKWGCEAAPLGDMTPGLENTIIAMANEALADWTPADGEPGETSPAKPPAWPRKVSCIGK